jgi:hypothetical protein
MNETTLFDFAARSPGARPLAGRGTAWSAALPDGTKVVVRHTRHGGMLAPVTRDLFLAPTRAPNELAAAIRLAQMDVPTPEVAAYAIYPAAGPFVRSDVATRLLEGTVLPDAWLPAAPEARLGIVEAIARLLAALRRAGAHHPDLNARNVFITGGDGRGEAVAAAVLDVDRVTFGAPGDASLATKNIERLLRSIVKSGLPITSREVVRLRESAAGDA